MSISVTESDPFKEMEEVASHMMKGASEYQAARRTGLKVVEVRALWNEYKERLNHDTLARDAARDYMNMMVRQYDELIQKAHSNLDELGTLVYDEKVSAQINATIKNIGDLQAKRVDTLQKAGLLDAHDLGDELAEREEREEMILKILREDLCDHCKIVVRDRISQLTGNVEGTVVDAEVVTNIDDE